MFQVASPWLCSSISTSRETLQEFEPPLLEVADEKTVAGLVRLLGQGICYWRILKLETSIFNWKVIS